MQQFGPLSHAFTTQIRADRDSAIRISVTAAKQRKNAADGEAVGTKPGMK
jgi:hypothetical protein